MLFLRLLIPALVRFAFLGHARRLQTEAKELIQSDSREAVGDLDAAVFGTAPRESFRETVKAFGSMLLASSPASAFPQASVRRVLVTGANKGIGRAICRRIALDYPDVHILLGSRSLGRGEQAVESILKEVPSAKIDVLEIDVSDDASVVAAAASVAAKYGEEQPLYGLVNNAGVGFGKSISDTLAVNYYGSKRVFDAFVPLLDAEAGRVCNIASASGPMFVRGLRQNDQQLFTSDSTTLQELEKQLGRYISYEAGDDDFRDNAYGLSKASLHVLTMQQAAAHPKLQINSCSPGYILTDITRGMGATKLPEESNCHVAPLFLLFGDVESPSGTAYYYGSDAVRSPIDRYRGPGDPPYRGD